MTPANATTTEDGRTYEWAGRIFDSVTTIIGQGTPTPAALERWQSRTIASYAVEQARTWMPVAEESLGAAVDLIAEEGRRLTQEAADRGSEVHEWADRIARGTAAGAVPPPLIGYVAAFQSFLDEWHPIFEVTEATVYSRRHGYAGTLDWMAFMPGYGLVLGDTKTKPTRRKQVYGKVALQLSAYRYADFIAMPDGSEMPVPFVDYCLVLVLRPDGYELREVRADEEAFDAFLACQTVRRFCNDTANTVLGPPLVMP